MHRHGGALQEADGKGALFTMATITALRKVQPDSGLKEIRMRLIKHTALWCYLPLERKHYDNNGK